MDLTSEIGYSRRLWEESYRQKENEYGYDLERQRKPPLEVCGVVAKSISQPVSDHDTHIVRTEHESEG